MLFDTPSYGLFLLVVFYGYWAIRHRERAARVFLLAASYFFYASWNIAYLGLIVFSTLLDFVCGAAIHRESRPRRRKLYLTASLVGNLGVLAIFKYLYFFTENLNHLTGLLGLAPIVPHVHLLLPVGISFYTFQTLSYTIEIYRGQIEPRTNLIDFALFVSFFPQLVAGPIVRASEFLPQLDEQRRLSRSDVGTGLFLLQRGLFKKIVLADFVGFNLVDPVFAAPEKYGGLAVLLAVYGFKLQIYADFSGYSDMAIGSARLLGFHLPDNFRAPYKAVSLPDYWRRWHMTMSTWFRDFLFFPLGGSRGSLARTCLNLMITMSLVGLWHGANWTFVAWGAYYGAWLSFYRIIRDPWNSIRERIPLAARMVLGWVTTFHLTAVASMIFRSPSITHARLLASRFGTFTGGESVALPCVAVMAVGYVLHLWPERWKEWCHDAFRNAPAPLQATALSALLALVAALALRENPFYYFQF